MEKTENFTQGGILRPLIRFALPVLLALFLQAMYGAVDLWVVGKYALAEDVSGVSTGSQIMQTVTMVIVGLSMGVTVRLGQKLGEGRPDEARSTIGSGICLFLAIALVMTAVMVFGAEGVARLMRAPEEAFAQTCSYVRICSAGMLFIVAYNILGSVFRGIGDSRLPLISVTIACVVNIVGDLLLVAVFHMGASGAAYATVFAQAVSVVLSFVIIRRRELPFTFSRRDIRFDRGVVGRILALGVPIALQDFLVSISFLVLLAIVNNMGLIASAGMGVAEKLTAFIMLVPSAFMQAMSAFVAQNIGAGKPERAKQALKLSILCSVAVGVLMGYLAFFHGEMLAGLFAREQEIIAAAADYLKAYAIDCMLTPFLFCFIGYYNGCGRTVFVMAQGILGAFGARIPVAYLVSRRASATLFQIGLATPASTVLQILLCLMAYCYPLFRKTDSVGDVKSGG